MIDGLEKNGFVKRAPDNMDRRSKRVLPTRHGLSVIQMLENIGSTIISEIMQGMSSEEEQRLIDLLSLMKRNLIKTEAMHGSVSGSTTPAAD